MKIVNTLQHYVRFGYKTFVVDNFVLDDPSDFEEVLKDEYVYKNGKLFKALKNTISKTENLNDRNIFIEITLNAVEFEIVIYRHINNRIFNRYAIV